MFACGVGGLFGGREELSALLVSAAGTLHFCTGLYIYSNVGLGSSLRGEPGLTTFRSQGCP